jgi:hypothetical protein
MANLLPLSEIPVRGGARDAERAARAQFASRNAALVAAEWELVEAPGTYSTPRPRSFGWCLSREAAEAASRASVVRMPGGTEHRIMVARFA